MKRGGIVSVPAPKPLAVANAPADGRRYGTEIPEYEIAGRRSKPPSEGIQK